MANRKPAARAPVARSSPTAPAAARPGPTGRKPSTGSASPTASGRKAASNGTGPAGSERRGTAGQVPQKGRTSALTARAGSPAERSAGVTADGAGSSLLARMRQLGFVPIAALILSLYGLGASIYLTIAHYDTHITLVCSDRGLINCEEVTTSPQSMVFGIFPVAVLGLAFYLFMVAANTPWAWRLQWPAVRWARLGSVIVGMGFVLYLIYAEVDQIRAICLWCTSVHVATFLLFVLLVFQAIFTWGRPFDSARS